MTAIQIDIVHAVKVIIHRIESEEWIARGAGMWTENIAAFHWIRVPQNMQQEHLEVFAVVFATTFRQAKVALEA